MKKIPIYLLAIAAPIGPMPYLCDHPMSILIATFYQTQPPTVLLQSKEQSVILSQELSGSGARYEGNGIEFWVKGNEAFVNWNGEKFNCKTK